MIIKDIYRRIDKYLNSADVRPRIINFRDQASILAFREHFDVGNAIFKSPSDYSMLDEDIMTEILYDELQKLQGDLFLIGFTSQLRLNGREMLQQFLTKIAGLSLKTGKLVIVCFQCEELLRFNDTRLQKIIYLADDYVCDLPKIRFVGKELLPKDEKMKFGVDKVGYLVETVKENNIVIRTQKHASDYQYSMLSIEGLEDAYALLCDYDHSTKHLDKALGNIEQWDFALREVTSAGSWSALVTHKFGNPYALELAVGQWDRLNKNGQWLYYIALKMFGVKNNHCLCKAVESSDSISDMVRKIYRSILNEDFNSTMFLEFYRERKNLLQQMFDVENETEIIDYIKMTKQHKKNAIRYLTNNTRQEKEAIIDMISQYASEYTHQEIHQILFEVYPELATYLNSYSFQGNTWLDSYFSEYRYSKVLNHVTPDLMAMAQKEAINRDFLKLLPRIAIVDGIPKDGTFLFFVDALGVEFIPYIVQKCSEYDLRISVNVAHCELPSLTRYNKDFYESYPKDQRTKVSELDDIIHHGKENYDYQVTKTPIHLIRELEIVDEVLRNARAKILSNKFLRVLLVSDHGATRMAVINEHIIDIDVNSKGTNGGRVCEYTDAVKTVPCAIREGDYYILASYDRFRGGHPSNVEAHGGGTLEEVVIPIIELSLAVVDIEVQVQTKVVEYSFKQKPILKLFSKHVLSNASVLINDKWYTADESSDGQNFSFILDGLKKGHYTAALYSSGGEVASGLTFEAKSKAGSSTGKAGIL